MLLLLCQVVDVRKVCLRKGVLLSVLEFRFWTRKRVAREAQVP